MDGVENKTLESMGTFLSSGQYLRTATLVGIVR